MIILRQKEFGRIKYPDDWDDDDFKYMDKIDKESNKKLVKDSLISAGMASLPSLTSLALTGKVKKPSISTGLAIGGASFLLGSMANNSNELKKKYRKLKNKKDRLRFQKEMKLNPGILETIKNNKMLLL